MFEVFDVRLEVVAIAEVNEVDETADGLIDFVNAVNSDGCKSETRVSVKIASLNLEHNNNQG